MPTTYTLHTMGDQAVQEPLHALYLDVQVMRMDCGAHNTVVPTTYTLHAMGDQAVQEPLHALSWTSR